MTDSGLSVGELCGRGWTSVPDNSGDGNLEVQLRMLIENI